MYIYQCTILIDWLHNFHLGVKGRSIAFARILNPSPQKLIHVDSQMIPPPASPLPRIPN